MKIVITWRGRMRMGNPIVSGTIDGVEFTALRQGGLENFWAFSGRTALTKEECDEFDEVCEAEFARGECQSCGVIFAPPAPAGATAECCACAVRAVRAIELPTAPECQSGLAPLAFVEAIRFVLCLSRDGFGRVFGEEAGRYQWAKFREEFNGDAARWICYLDTGNAGLLVAAINAHLTEHGV